MSAPPDKDQRQLPPTPKRIEEFRKRGEIALSREVVGVAALAAAAATLAATAPAIASACRAMFVGVLGELERPVPRTVGIAQDTLVAAAAPVLLVGVAAAVGAIGGQIGWPPALKRPGFDLSRLASVAAVGELLSPRAIARRLALSSARLAAALAAAAVATWPELERLAAAPALDGAATLRVLVAACGRVAIVTGGVLAVLAALDLLHVRRTVGARMKMTPEEYKREAREQDGDPHVKRRRRQRMRELARRRVGAAVKGADVVLVNPTEYAVALRYRADEDAAPVVVAKGRGAAAEHIRALARAHGVPVIAQPPLARLLHKLVPEGRAIPATLFQAVAEVLAYVYRLRRRAAGAAARPGGAR